jgi:hypothetical protein
MTGLVFAILLLAGGAQNNGAHSMSGLAIGTTWLFSTGSRRRTAAG